MLEVWASNGKHDTSSATTEATTSLHLYLPSSVFTTLEMKIYSRHRLSTAGMTRASHLLNALQH
jgi:hypothetical protein